MVRCSHGNSDSECGKRVQFSWGNEVHVRASREETESGVRTQRKGTRENSHMKIPLTTHENSSDQCFDQLEEAWGVIRLHRKQSQIWAAVFHVRCHALCPCERSDKHDEGLPGQRL